MPSETLGCRTPEPRGARRASMYLAAVLHAGALASPARVRNMSSTGALVEANTVPHPGTVIRLVRGGLAADGEVMWARGGRCGLRFHDRVDCHRWLAPPANREQERIDAGIRKIRAAGVSTCAALPVSPPTVDPMATWADHLALTGALLRSLGESLAADTEVVSRHVESLQKFDLAVQMLESLAIGVARNGLGRAELSSLDNLRRCTQQALGNRWPA